MSYIGLVSFPYRWWNCLVAFIVSNWDINCDILGIDMSYVNEITKIITKLLKKLKLESWELNSKRKEREEIREQENLCTRDFLKGL